MVNVHQTFIVKKIYCSECHDSNSKILDFEYFTLNVPQSSIFIGFSNIWYQNVWKSIIYSKNIQKKVEDMVNVS